MSHRPLDRKFRTAFRALQALYSDERVEEYLAGGIEEFAIGLAADFGYMVDPGTAQLVEMPNHNAEEAS